MPEARSVRHKVRFYISAGLLYSFVLFGVVFLTLPVSPITQSRPVALTKASTYVAQNSRTVQRISGIPIRLVIPGSAIDIPVNPGYYNAATGQWTLSGFDAQFASVSSPANNVTGETFIYGHNNDFVFGSLRHNTPLAGSLALLYTSNGHIFSYTFQSVVSLGPTDTSVLDYNGPPILMIQTCTGSLNEWRTEYTYSFNKVVQ